MSEKKNLHGFVLEEYQSLVLARGCACNSPQAPSATRVKNRNGPQGAEGSLHILFYPWGFLIR